MKNLLIIVLAGLVFSACTKTATKPNSQDSNKAPATDQKQGDISKTGRITESSGTYFLTAIGQQPEIIESYSVELANYVGQTVTVTGQYSGDTLFVGKVE